MLICMMFRVFNFMDCQVLEKHTVLWILISHCSLVLEAIV